MHLFGIEDKEELGTLALQCFHLLDVAALRDEGQPSGNRYEVVSSGLGRIKGSDQRFKYGVS